MKYRNNSTVNTMLKEIAQHYGIETYQARKALEIVIQNLQVFDKKQKDYGPYNICGNPHPELGVAFRSGDKVNRLMNLFLKSDEPVHESVLDSWIDLSNYGLIGQMLHKDVWLEKEEPKPVTDYRNFDNVPSTPQH